MRRFVSIPPGADAPKPTARRRAVKAAEDVIASADEAPEAA